MESFSNWQKFRQISILISFTTYHLSICYHRHNIYVYKLIKTNYCLRAPIITLRLSESRERKKNTNTIHSYALHTRNDYNSGKNNINPILNIYIHHFSFFIIQITVNVENFNIKGVFIYVNGQARPINLIHFIYVSVLLLNWKNVIESYSNKQNTYLFIYLMNALAMKKKMWK